MTSIILIAVGGLVTMTGSARPWLSMFAGLKQYSGLLGLNGWLVLAIGLILALTPYMERRGIRTAPLAIILSLGAMLVVAYAGSGLLAITANAGNALMVPKVGPGLPVALAGCFMSLAAAIVAQRHARTTNTAN